MKASLSSLKSTEAPLEDVLESWAVTLEYRRNWMLMNKNPLVHDLFAEWPILMTPVAPQLIRSDFAQLNLVAGEPIDKWNDFMKIICNNNQCRDNSVTALRTVIGCKDTSAGQS